MIRPLACFGQRATVTFLWERPPGRDLEAIATGRSLPQMD
jgi:hypothetical protein